MRISLSSSLHLDHGLLSMDARLGDNLTVMQSFVPVGLLSLKASCEMTNPEVHIRVFEVNTMINRGEIKNEPHFYAQVASAVLDGGSELAGLMTDADSLHHTIAIARSIKARSPSTLVCLGGPASSPIACKILERFLWVDFVVRGEGEETFAELVRYLIAGRNIGDIQGLTWRSPKGAVITNIDRPPISNLDELPIPHYAAFDAMESAALYMDVGRGCPFRCNFCSTAPFWDRRFRMKSISRIVEEIKLLRDQWNRRHINFSHDIFTADKQWTREFCRTLSEMAIGVTWTCSTRTDCVDKETLAAMAEAGCVEIYYGIETGDAVMQTLIDKSLLLEQSLQIIRDTRNHGIRSVTGFIVGYPNETQESYGRTLNFFFQLLEEGVHRAHIFTLCPFPGSPLFKKVDANLERRAQDMELPIEATSHAESETLVIEYPDVFASRYRYATPNISEPLIMVTEEISAHIMTLRRLWPLVLPLFECARDLFENWAIFINERNKPKPWRRPYHGNATDLIDFVVQEVAQRNNTSPLLADLLVYEKTKLAAACLEAHVSVRPPSMFSHQSYLVASRSFLIASFRNDIATLISDLPVSPTHAKTWHWVVFARNDTGTVDTFSLSEIARRLLESARTPQSLSSLIEAATLEPELDEQASAHAFEALQSLKLVNLIEEINL